MIKMSKTYTHTKKKQQKTLAISEHKAISVGKYLFVYHL